MTKENLMQTAVEAMKPWIIDIMVEQAKTSNVLTPCGFFAQNETKIEVVEIPSLFVDFQSGLAKALVLQEDGLFWVKSFWPKPEGVDKKNSPIWDYSSRREVPAEEYLTYFQRVERAILTKENAAREKEFKK